MKAGDVQSVQGRRESIPTLPRGGMQHLPRGVMQHCHESMTALTRERKLIPCDISCCFLYTHTLSKGWSNAGVRCNRCNRCKGCSRLMMQRVI
jgi:hypothetical protein